MKKKLLAILMAFVAVSMMLVSCNKAEKKILGSWTNTEASYICATAGGEQLYKEPFAAGEMKMTFNDDGTCVSEGQSATWAIDGDKLTITYQKETGVFDILSLEKDQMVLEMTESNTTAGVTTDFKMHLEMVKE